MAQRLPEAVRLAHSFKADLLKGEEGHQFEMARRYLDVEQKLQDRIVALTDKVALMRAAGQEVNVGKLYLLDRWQSLEKQMLSELSSFNGWALERIKDRQIELGRQGVANAGELMRAAGLVGSFDKLPVDAVTAMVGMAGDGAPIRDLLAESYPKTADAIAQTIVDGVALGRAPEVVAKDAAGGLGIPLDRAFLVARTEELRAYRTGSQMQYSAAGITEYRRLATLDDATCIGCLAADGEIMDNADAFDAHPACRCTSVPIVPEATMPEWQSSEDWFNQQDAATQEGIMGPGRLDAYESGAAQWSDLWTKTDDPVWGGSIVPTNVGDLPVVGTPAAAAVVAEAEQATASAAPAAVPGSPVIPDLQPAASVAEALDSLKQVMGTDRVQFMDSLPGFGKKASAARQVEHANALVDELNGMFGRFPEMPRDAVANFVNSNDARGHAHAGGPSMSWAQPRGKDVVARLLKWEEENGKPWGAQRPEFWRADNVRHEYGHSLSIGRVVNEFAEATRAYQQRVGAEIGFEGKPNQMKLWVQSSYAHYLTENVTQYATGDLMEQIAESFCYYTRPGYEPGSLPPEIEGVLERLTRGIIHAEARAARGG